MPTDPRLAGNAFGITDPVMAQLAAMRIQMADQQRQINDLRAAATIQTGSGVPTGTARNGTPYLDVTGRRFYVMATTWGFAALT